MEITTLDRSPVRLPSLTMPDVPADSVPAELRTVHAHLQKVASEAADKAIKLASDDRWSEPERAKQQSALCTSAVEEIEKVGAVVAQVERLADEREAAALRTALKPFDGARLLAIGQSLASRSREERLAAYLRCRQNDDRETMAAFVTAPRELGVTDGIDPRLIDALKDRLIDSVDPKVRASVSTARFAAARLRTGRANAIETLRRLTGTVGATQPVSVRASA